MWQDLMWKIVWAIIPIILGVARGLIEETCKAVKDAETAGGTSSEKRAYVWNRMVDYMAQSGQTIGTSTKNALLELAVVYIKEKTSA
jgi:hypothetical protein